MTAWSSLDLRRRTIVLLATVGVFVSVLMLARMATTPRMALLYAGLEPSAAGDVVSALEAQGASFDVRGNAIYVDAGQRDALRMILARDGLPSNGGQGYELLDSLSGFGTTAQMFDAAYWRAKEGELARTIAAIPQIAAVRVHLSNPARDPFLRGQVASASVTVTTRGAGLDGAQTMALRHLVAAAVAGLDPENVAVIDSRSGLIPLENPSATAFGADTRAEMLRRNITRLIEARVGKGNAVVEVAVDTVTERETISERRIEPDSRIAISSDREESATRANDARPGAVTVASNLPAGDAEAGGGRSESTESRSREVVNYEVSEMQREILREPGAVRRISVAVLVDGIRDVDDAGEPTWTPRDDAELESLRELVASTIAFDAARGDSITIKSMAFEPPPAAAEPVAPGFLDRFPLDLTALAQLGVLAVVSLVLGLFVLRPLLRPAAASGVAQLPAPPAPRSDDAQALTVFEGELSGPGATPAETAADGAAAPRAGAEDPATLLRRMIESRKDETVEVLSQWMKDEPEQVP